MSRLVREERRSRRDALPSRRPRRVHMTERPRPAALEAPLPQPPPIVDRVVLPAHEYDRLRSLHGRVCIYHPYECVSHRSRSFWCEFCMSRFMFPELYPCAPPPIPPPPCFLTPNYPPAACASYCLPACPPPPSCCPATPPQCPPRAPSNGMCALPPS